MDTHKTSSTGLAPNVAAGFSYLAWWVSGLLFYLVERENRFVKFHAAQALVGLGALFGAGFLLFIVALASLFVSAGAFKIFIYLSYAVWLVGIIAWAVCVVRAWKGEEFELPWAGQVARRMSASLNP